MPGLIYGCRGDSSEQNSCPRGASIAVGKTNNKEINKEIENITVGSAKCVEKRIKQGLDRGSERGGLREAGELELRLE